MADQWRWNYENGPARTMLVDVGSRPGIVLCAAGSKLMTRDPVTGVLIPVREDLEVAKRLALAPAHTKLASAFALGVLRYELFSGSENSGELCVNGLRHASRLDEFGVPRMTPGVWEGIDRAWAVAYG